MQINGKEIAQQLLVTLHTRVTRLQKEHQLTPHLAVIRVGDDPAVTAYINQKVRTGEQLGINVTVIPFPNDITDEALKNKIEELNKDKKTHAIILQLPIPSRLHKNELLEMIQPEKDVDGFHPQSNFFPPIATAVEAILKHIFTISEPLQETSFDDWLHGQSIAILGKGKTGGQPMIQLLRSKQIEPIIIDSKTIDASKKLKQADIIITAVGKKHMLHKDRIKPGVILIGIGMTKEADGKFYGDYNIEEIKDIAGFYTPIPGGVGPVNVATLMENVVKAAENSLQ